MCTIPEEYLDRLEQDVQAGFEALSEIRPGFHNQIDIDTLDISCSENCIIGQLEGDYSRNKTKWNGLLEKKGLTIETAGLVCPSRLMGWTTEYHMKLTSAWKNRIKNKRDSEKSSSEKVFEAALPLTQFF